MNYNTTEEALKAWDIEHDTDKMEKIKNKFLHEQLKAYILEKDDQFRITVALPSKKKVAYIFLSAIVNTMAIAEKTSVENILNELEMVLDLGILDPNPKKI